MVSKSLGAIGKVFLFLWLTIRSLPTVAGLADVEPVVEPAREDEVDPRPSTSSSEVVEGGRDLDVTKPEKREAMLWRSGLGG